MKRIIFRGLLTGIALFYCTLIGLCQSIPSQPEIRFRMVHDTLIVVSMTANGQGPFDFMLDTGVDMTIVDSSLAAQLSLDPLGQVLQVSVGGSHMLKKSSIDVLSLGDVQVEHHRVLIEDLSEMRKMDPRIQGIVGQEFLAHFNYLLDYKRHSIRIERADVTDGEAIRNAVEGVSLPMEVKQSKMLVEVESQSARSEKLELVLDSGATNMVLMKNATLRLKLPVVENRFVQTLVGNIAVHTGAIPLLTVGGERLHQVKAVLSTDSVGQFGDGLLPTSLFESLFVDNGESFVILNPRVKRGSRR